MRCCGGCRARGGAKARAGHPGDSGRAAPDALHGTAPFSRGGAIALRVSKDSYHLFDQNGQAMTA